MVSGNLAKAEAVAVISVEDGVPVGASRGFRELLGAAGDGRDDVARLVSGLPLLAHARAGAPWEGAVELPAIGAVWLRSEPCGPVTILSASTHPGSGRFAQAQLAACERLAQGAVHDARNPLNALAIHLELARSRLADLDPAVTERLARNLTAAREQIARTEAVLKRFVRFAAPVASSGELDLAELLGQAVEVCTHEARRCGVRVETRLQAARVVGEAAPLTAAALLLVVHGIDAARPGGQLSVAVDCVAGGARVQLIYQPGSEPGAPCPIQVGVAADADPSLLAARQIVELQRGTLTARVEGQRTVVEVQLPTGLAARVAGT